MINQLMKNQKLMAGGVVAGIVILAIGGFLYYQSSQKSQQAISQNQQENRKLVEEVGKLVELPVGEEPTIATVTDVDKLKDQPFFQKAQNGDKVLIYTNAKKAYLYSPTLKKVLDIAPINIGSPSAQISSPSPSPTPET